MSNYYTFLLLGPTVYNKYYSDPPSEPGEADLHPIKLEIQNLKKITSMKRIKILYSMSEELKNLLNDEFSERQKEVFECMKQIPSVPFSKTSIDSLLNSKTSHEEIVTSIPVSLIIKSLDEYTSNKLVRSALGITAENIYDLLNGYKSVVIPYYLGYKNQIVNFKLGVTDTKGNSLRKDYISMSIFLISKKKNTYP